MTIPSQHVQTIKLLTRAPHRWDPPFARAVRGGAVNGVDFYATELAAHTAPHERDGVTWTPVELAAVQALSDATPEERAVCLCEGDRARAIHQSFSDCPEHVEAVWQGSTTDERIDGANRVLWDRDIPTVAQRDSKRIAWALAHGADLHMRGPHGDTPLHHAARHTAMHRITTLLDVHADPMVRNSDGKTPWDLLQGRFDERDDLPFGWRAAATPICERLQAAYSQREREILTAVADRPMAAAVVKRRM